MQSCPSDEAAHKMADNSVIVHFVADNVDHNIRTLDGLLNTFHGMGIISATILPVGDFDYQNRVVRQLEKLMLADDAAQNKCTPIHLFDTGHNGLHQFMACCWYVEPKWTSSFKLVWEHAVCIPRTAQWCCKCRYALYCRLKSLG